MILYIPENWGPTPIILICVVRIVMGETRFGARVSDMTSAQAI